MRKALFWEQICFALSPQEGASGHHMLPPPEMLDAKEMLKTRCCKHGHPGEGQLPLPG